MPLIWAHLTGQAACRSETVRKHLLQYYTVLAFTTHSCIQTPDLAEWVSLSLTCLTIMVFACFSLVTVCGPQQGCGNSLTQCETQPIDNIPNCHHHWQRQLPPRSQFSSIIKSNFMPSKMLHHSLIVLHLFVNNF